MKEVFVVPEPKEIRFKGKWLKFDGFKNFPEFLAQEFDVPRGEWSIVKIEGDGTGVEVTDKEVKMWGEERIAYATILQFIKQGKGSLPEVKVQEDFQFLFRGYHLDIARGGVPKVETFKKLLRWLYLLKYNYLGIYFEDLFPWSKYPQIGRHRGRLTEEELKEIIDYGRKLGIEVFPSLELSGHMEHTLSLPEFYKFSEWYRPREGCLNLSDEKAREFAYELLKEVVDFFPSKHIHIGGDETWALGRGKSLNKTWKFEGPRLYELHHREMVNIVKSKGKLPILWGDMISGMYLREQRAKWAEVIDSEIWNEVLIANWDYSPRSKQHFKEKIEIFKKRGLKQIACPGLANWNKYYPNFRTALENLKNFLEAAKEENVYGFLVTVWGDDGWECLFSFLDPLILASMEIAEGNGKWEEKWKAITGESEDILKARLLLGQPEISEMIKHTLFADFWFYRLNSEKWKSLESSWKGALEELGSTNLPEDLEFIRRCLKVMVKMIENEATVSDYLALSNIYSKLWLAERKEEGLGKIIGRFWGTAARIDAKIISTPSPLTFFQHNFSRKNSHKKSLTDR